MSDKSPGVLAREALELKNAVTEERHSDTVGWWDKENDLELHAKEHYPTLCRALIAAEEEKAAAVRDRDELWCRCLFGVLDTRDVQKVTETFNRMRPDPAATVETNRP